MATWSHAFFPRFEQFACFFFSIFSSNCLVMILNFVMIGCCNHFGFGNRLVPNPDKIFVSSYNRGTILCLWFTHWFPGKFFYCIQIVNIEELFRKTSPWELILFEERICGPAVACRLNRKRDNLHLKQMQIILDWTLRNVVIYIHMIIARNCKFLQRMWMIRCCRSSAAGIPH